jgi:predicted nucleotidyltransferase
MEQTMPTALELRADGWKRYLDAARRRPLPKDLTPAERRERDRLLVRVRQAASILKAQFGVRRIVLLGSLAHTAWFTRESDVDLAVEGLGSADYWRAWRAVEDVIADREVDLIQIETATVSLQRAIERYGVEL